MLFLYETACKHTRCIQNQSKYTEKSTETPNIDRMLFLLLVQERQTNETNRAATYQYNAQEQELYVIVTCCIG